MPLDCVGLLVLLSTIFGLMAADLTHREDS